MTECLECGTCCFSRLEAYVPVTGDDHARLGEAAETLVWFDGNRAFMRMIDGHCVALRIELDGHFVCQTYETRPATCRNLANGSGACLGEIENKGERPPIALRLRRARLEP